MLCEHSAAVADSLFVLEATTVSSTRQATGMGWERAVVFPFILLSNLAPMVERMWLTELLNLSPNLSVAWIQKDGRMVLCLCDEDKDGG
jgi:hypothetical protein